MAQLNVNVIVTSVSTSPNAGAQSTWPYTIAFTTAPGDSSGVVYSGTITGTGTPRYPVQATATLALP